MTSDFHLNDLVYSTVHVRYRTTVPPYDSTNRTAAEQVH